MVFCDDMDLLHWEPNIFRDAAAAAQTLLSGTGDLAGTTFTLDNGSLYESHIQPNQVIVLSGSIAGSYLIVSVDADGQLTLSVLHDKLFPDDGPPEAAPVGTALDLAFTIRSFWAQRRVVSGVLEEAIGVAPGMEDESATIINPQVLKRVCVLGTLQMIYNALAAAAEEPARLALRADLYERLYRQAIRSVCVELDLNGDGEADAVRRLDVRELVRG